MRKAKNEIKFNLLSNSGFWESLSPSCTCSLFKNILRSAPHPTSQITGDCMLLVLEAVAKGVGSDSGGIMRFSRWIFSIFRCWISKSWRLVSTFFFFSLHPFHLPVHYILKFISTWLLLKFCSALNQNVAWGHGGQHNETTKTDPKIQKSLACQEP